MHKIDQSDKIHIAYKIDQSDEIHIAYKIGCFLLPYMGRCPFNIKHFKIMNLH